MRLPNFIYQSFHRIRNSIIELLIRRKASTIILNQKILVVAPHPDDEVLGCGNLIAKAVQEGIQIKVAILTKGENISTIEKLSSSEIQQRRMQMTFAACKGLGVKDENIIFFDFPDGGINSAHPEKIKLVKLVEEYHPDQIFVTSPFDLFPDHVNAYKLMNELAKGVHCSLYCYFVWFWFFFKLRQIPLLSKYNFSYTRMDRSKKSNAIDLYFKDKDKFGNPLSGQLPLEMIESALSKREYYLQYKV